MITKIKLPNEDVFDSAPKAEGWSYKENLGHLAVAERITFSGSGTRNIASGVISVAASETVTVNYPFLPGHLYRLEATVAGSASLAVTAAGTSLGVWTAGDQSVTFKPTAGAQSITLVEGAAATGTITGLTLTLLQTPDFSIAHQN